MKLRSIQVSRADALWIALAGALTGAASAVLTRMGNPIDGGMSVACFLRDIAGAIGFHQYLEFSAVRAELLGILLGAGGWSILNKRFKPQEGSSPATRFIIGMIMAWGVFVFVGCPMRTVLRLAGGDPVAVGGLAGLICGVWIGTVFLKRGFTLPPPRPASYVAALLPHGALLVLLIFALLLPSAFTVSARRSAPLLASLGAGIVIGIIAQHTKLCFIGGWRNFFLIGDLTLLCGVAAFAATAFSVNLFLGQLHLGTHIIGPSDTAWSFLAALEVGLASTLLGGCPFRQMILCGQGNADSAATLLGLMTGAAIAYNFPLASVGGSVDLTSKIAVTTGIALLITIAIIHKDHS